MYRKTCRACDTNTRAKHVRSWEKEEGQNEPIGKGEGGKTVETEEQNSG